MPLSNVPTLEDRLKKIEDITRKIEVVRCMEIIDKLVGSLCEQYKVISSGVAATMIDSQIAVLKEARASMYKLYTEIDNEGEKNV